MSQSLQALIVFLSFCTLIFVLYYFFLAVLHYTWQPEPAVKDTPFEAPISVVIPCYNDAAQLAILLGALKQKPTAEVVVVNDHSDADNSALLIELSRIHSFILLDNSGEGKKDALRTGIQNSQSEIIVQLDADVIPSDHFLQNLTAPFANEQTKMVLGLVKMEPANNVWSKLAALDFLSLQFSGHALAQKGKAIMGNGAALAYRREVFDKHHDAGKLVSSGDDVFLIQALAKEEAQSIKTAAQDFVTTSAPANFKAFIRQRIRWGGKTMAYPSMFAKGVAFLIAAVNWFALLLLLLSFFSKVIYISFIMLFALKLVIEYLVLANFARKTDQIRITEHFYLAALYPFYIALTTLLILFAKEKTTWKGRPLKT